MAFVSVTRLRVRSPWYLLPFVYHTWVIVRQLGRADGYLQGRLATGRHRTFWTLTVWQDDQAMRAFRNADAHMRAMPKLLAWCDEASVVHWEQESAQLPGIVEAQQKMIAEGRLSKVRHPSDAHAADRIPRDPLLREGPRLRPVGRT